MSDALLIAAHGSRDEAGVAELRTLAEAWQRLRPDRPQAAGFLEFARPTIGEAADTLVNAGAKRVVVVPAMLTAAGHVKNDVPSEIHEARGRHPLVAFSMARPLDIHPSLLELAHLRYREALVGRPEVQADRTLLLLVGRGTSDPDANAGIARVARFLWEAYGVAWANVAYAGLAAPGADEALAVCRRMGYARIVVQPYLLLDGVLLKRIREAAARHAQADPGVEIVATGHLGVHPLLVQAFEDRAHEALHGTPAMACDVCKYRVRLIGREADLGAPQVGNHHHSRAEVEYDDHDHGPRRSRRRPSSAEADPAGHPWDERLLRRLLLAT
jgi:sirohydrochlorin ferrochelatase